MKYMLMLAGAGFFFATAPGNVEENFQNRWNFIDLLFKTIKIEPISIIFSNFHQKFQNSNLVMLKKMSIRKKLFTPSDANFTFKFFIFADGVETFATKSNSLLQIRIRKFFVSHSLKFHKFCIRFASSDSGSWPSVNLKRIGSAWWKLRPTTSQVGSKY